MASSSRRVLLLLSAAVAAAAGLVLYLYYPEPPRTPSTMPRLPRAGEPITEVPIVAVKEVGDSIPESELVLGVVLDGEARAYPLSQLTDVPARKAVNDTLAGKPIAMTWCDSCFTGVIYSREVEGKTLTLVVGPALDRYSMVLFDLETKTDWIHHSGVAKSGPLAGRALKVLPSVMTDWATWRKLYPDSTLGLFDKEAGKTRREYLDQWPLKTWSLGLADGDGGMAWTLEKLSKEGAIHDSFKGKAVVAFFDRPSKSARAFERTLDGKTLTFAWADGKFTDKETGSEWNPVSGKATTGPLAGKSLTAMPGQVSTQQSWTTFHSNSEMKE